MSQLTEDDFKVDASRMNCQKILLKMDLVGGVFNWYLPNGKKYYKTTMGGIFLILCFLVVLAYILATFIELIERSNYSIQNRELDNFYTDKNFRFSKE